MSEIPHRLRLWVLERAEGRCEYCRIPVQGQIVPFPVDHVIPRASGGETAFDNLALACPRCNGHKWSFEDGIDPVDSKPHRLFHPRKDRWHQHFEWADEDSPLIRGKSSNRQSDDLSPQDE